MVEAPDGHAFHDRIKTELQGPLDAQWEEVLKGGAQAGADRTDVLTSVSNIRDRLVEDLLEIDDLEELQQELALSYVEVKGQWLGLNARIQRRAARSNSLDDALVYWTSCIGLLLRRLERLIDWKSVGDLSQLLSEPIFGRIPESTS